MSKGKLVILLESYFWCFGENSYFYEVTSDMG